VAVSTVQLFTFSFSRVRTTVLFAHILGKFLVQ